MLWLLRCVVMVACLTTLGTAVSLQQCKGQGLLTLTPDQPYNITCPHDDTTLNVTWLFTSLLDPPAYYVITQDCVLFARSSEAYCQSSLPGFRVVRPQYGYTSLEVDWGQLAGAMTFGRVSCALDGVKSGACFLRLLVEGTAPSSTPSSSGSTTTSLSSASTERTATTSEHGSSEEVSHPQPTGKGTGMTSESVLSTSTTPAASESTSTDTPTTTITTREEDSSISSLPTATATTQTSFSSHRDRVIVIVIVVGILTTVPAIIVGIIVFCLRRKRKQRFQSMSNEEGSVQFESTLEDNRGDLDLCPPATKK
ncbi:hypothetical protein ACOMHN_021318 [Nucella lapillus]